MILYEERNANQAITFCDAAEPQVLTAIKEANILQSQGNFLQI